MHTVSFTKTFLAGADRLGLAGDALERVTDLVAANPRAGQCVLEIEGLYDALDVEQWLELSPAISIWFGEQLGLSGSGLISIDESWRVWSDQTEPSLAVGTMLAKREELQQQILRAVASEQRVELAALSKCVPRLCVKFMPMEACTQLKTLLVTLAPPQ